MQIGKIIHRYYWGKFVFSSFIDKRVEETVDRTKTGKWHETDWEAHHGLRWHSHGPPTVCLLTIMLIILKGSLFYLASSNLIGGFQEKNKKNYVCGWYTADIKSTFYNEISTGFCQNSSLAQPDIQTDRIGNHFTLWMAKDRPRGNLTGNAANNVQFCAQSCLGAWKCPHSSRLSCNVFELSHEPQILLYSSYSWSQRMLTVTVANMTAFVFDRKPLFCFQADISLEFNPGVMNLFDFKTPHGIQQYSKTPLTKTTAQ